jgi:hypothetical protein
MIFQPALAERVMSGEKTVTRRLCNHENHRSPWWVGGCGYRVGQRFAVNPGRGKFNIGHARVVAVERVGLEHLDDDEARREGFANAAEFEQALASINGGYVLGTSVWRIEFELL